MTPKLPDWWEEATAPNSPVAVTALGLAYRVGNQIESIEPGSPAAKAEVVGPSGAHGHLEPGMSFAQAQLIPPPPKPGEKVPPADHPAKFAEDGIGWPYVNELLQAPSGKTAPG